MTESTDPFGLESDFGMPQAIPDGKPDPAKPNESPQVQSTDKPSPKFRQEIDLKDGSGVQIFEADTAEAMVEKLAKAQEHATREIRKLQRAAKVKPDRGGGKPALPSPSPEIQPLSLEEEAAFAESFQQSPGATFTKLFKRTTGLSPEQFQQMRTNTDSIVAAQEEGKAANQFLIDHQDDYYPTQNNYRKLLGVLNAEDLPATVQNLNYAFQQVESELDPLPGETPAGKQPAAASTKVAPTQEKVKPQRTGISSTDTEPAPEPGASTPNVKELLTGTMAEQRDKIQRALRAQGQSSS